MVSKVGAHEVWKVTSRDFIAPSTTTILTHNVTDGTVSKIEGAAGSSALGQLAGPAAAVGAAYFIGKGIEESGDQNTTNVNQAQDGASANSEGSYARAEGGGAGGKSMASADSTATGGKGGTALSNATGGTAFSNSSAAAVNKNSNTAVNTNLNSNTSRLVNTNRLNNTNINANLNKNTAKGGIGGGWIPPGQNKK